jgi:hypothetical protein
MSRTRTFLKAILPLRVQRVLRDRVEDLKRRRPGPHRGLSQYGLGPTQVYPFGVNFDETLRAGIAPRLEGLVIRRDTPVASLGSCFADEFAKHMRAERFNYVTTEPSLFPSSADWGHVYTIPGFRQIVSYSTSDDFPMPVEHGPQGWFDPLRERRAGYFATHEEAAAAIRSHRAASHRAFAEACVLIVTLGQNEAWTDPRSGLVWAQRPPDPEAFDVRTFSFEENVAWMEESLARLRQMNPGLDVLLTVSPVGSTATFSDDEIITHSFAGKCLLRTVVERITRTVPRVWYFPSFEMALAYNPTMQMSDNRHVKNARIDQIFKLLHDTVVR